MMLKRLMLTVAITGGVLAYASPAFASADSVKSIKLDQVYSETASTSDDYHSASYEEYYYDTFKFTVSRKGRVVYEIKADDKSLITLAKFRIYAEDSIGDIVGFIVSPEYDSKSGKYIGNYDGGGYRQVILDPGTYYFAAQYDPSTASENPYEFTINVIPSEPTVEVPSISKLTAKSKGFTVKWKKVSSDGYQLQYATNKTFKSGKQSVTIKNNKTVQKTVKKLKAKKKYYVRVRAYKIADGTKYYSSWSGIKTVVTK